MPPVQQIDVKCNKGYNGIREIDATAGTVQFKTTGNCQFETFHLTDTSGTNPPPGFTANTTAFPSKTVSYTYTGEAIPSDGYFFDYTTVPKTDTTGDGTGVIKNK